MGGAVRWGFIPLSLRPGLRLGDSLFPRCFLRPQYIETEEKESRSMKRMGKTLGVTALALCLLLSLSACIGGVSAEDVTALVQGNIDEIYLGKYDEDYLKMVDSTAAEAEQAYLDGLEIEAEFFVNYWGIVDAGYGESYADLDAGFRQEVVELYKEIYSHTKYEVQPAVKLDDGSYTVKVLVDPIDIMEQAEALYMNDEYAPLNAFWEKYAYTDFSAMSDAEYMDYTHEYGEIIVQMLRDLLPQLGYTEQKTQAIQVEVGEDGRLQINEDDWGIFDSYVIYYP